MHGNQKDAVAITSEFLFHFLSLTLFLSSVISEFVLHAISTSQDLFCLLISDCLQNF